MPSRIAAALSLLLLLAACAGAVAPTPVPSIDGREFVSTSITEDGVERALVAGTVIRLTFQDGRVGVSAGCNHIGGDYAIDAGRLLVGNLASTAMGCDPPRHAQDDWLSSFLGASPAFTVDDTELILEAGGTRVVLVDN